MNFKPQDLHHVMVSNLHLKNLDTNNSKELFEFVLEHLPDAIYWIGKDWKIVYANVAASTMLGYSKSELIGKSMLSLHS